MTARLTGGAIVVALALALGGCAVVVASDPAPTPVVETPVAIEESDLNGLYEVTITQDELIAGGVTDPALVAEYAGLYYWTFDDGRWIYDQTTELPLANPGGVGDFTIEGTRYTHYWGDDPTQITTATLAVLEDGSLKFSDIVDSDPSLQAVSEVTFGLHPWVRVGD